MACLTQLQKEELVRFAQEQGFDVARVTGADFGPEPGKYLDEFLDKNHHGDMDWLEARKSWRQNPKTLWPEANSAVVLALNYGPDTDPRMLADQPDHGIISVYARRKDYHDVIKKRLKAIARHMVQTFGGDVKVFVDTAPVMEKPLAAAAGVGWQGKHTNLLSRDFGSWLFLGVILSTLEIDPDPPAKGGCGSCTACLDACPTQAFEAPYKLNASRCISYLTIETRSHIPREFRSAIENRIYGCDDCLAACPWNKYAQISSEMAIMPKEELNAPLLAQLVELQDAEFRVFFAQTPVKRLGRNRFIRNVLIALGNTKDKSHMGKIEILLEDSSPIVRLAAVWALGQIIGKQEYLRLFEKYCENENDPAVQAEWNLSMKEMKNEPS
ncbi:tRNA epoxyqueuosine(34) reductase QueG [Alphaproteobacteria bacterium 46_93_T64]|nr:tRNA epoxyqueuosine(34) reductase QueG [Alphaproteobacteria bacterium 46_93_T64]